MMRRRAGQQQRGVNEMYADTEQLACVRLVTGQRSAERRRKKKKKKRGKRRERSPESRRSAH